VSEVGHNLYEKELASGVLLWVFRKRTTSSISQIHVLEQVQNQNVCVHNRMLSNTICTNKANNIQTGDCFAMCLFRCSQFLFVLVHRMFLGTRGRAACRLSICRRHLRCLWVVGRVVQCMSADAQPHIPHEHMYMYIYIYTHTYVESIDTHPLRNTQI